MPVCPAVARAYPLNFGRAPATGLAAAPGLTPPVDPSTFALFHRERPLRTRWIAAALAAAAALSTPAALAQQPIDVLTGSTSGVYYPLGVAIAKIFSDIPSTNVRVQTSDGSIENLLLLQQGGGQIGFVVGDSLEAAWNGDAAAGFATRLDRLRVIGAIYPNYIQIFATAASGIRTLADLKGKSLSVGAAKSGTELNARTILTAAGLGFDDLGRVDYLSFADSIAQMNAKKLDATLQSAGLGVTSLKELSSASNIVVVAVPKAVVDRIGPPFMPAVIPANSYTGQDRDVPTAAVMNYLVTSSAVSDDLAYAMTRLVFESLPKLAIAHAVGKDIKLESAATGPVPLHPGAVRFYRDKGLLGRASP